MKQLKFRFARLRSEAGLTFEVAAGGGRAGRLEEEEARVSLVLVELEQG